MRTEIRRERNIELYFEGFRIDDLKRWKTAEVEMPIDVQGDPAMGYGTLETGRKWSEQHYLLPIPIQQIQLNPNLTQNPGWQ
jgi:starch-binding outer membrane protein, SusD/RagB family